MSKIEIANVSDVANDISSLVDHIASLSTKDKDWFSKIYFREVIKSNHYAVQSQDESATHVNYVGSQELLDSARYIVDWLAGLQEREPKQYGKLARITFQQALKHSEKWHAELAKKAEQSERYIEPDAKNAPKVLDLGDGWEVFWLKTNTARDIEGEVMGHCVGSGAYDNLKQGEEIFSIRKNSIAHITLHMDQLKIKQAVTKGNGNVPERYQHLVDEASGILGAKLFVEYPLQDTSRVPDGWHTNSEGDKIHLSNGLINSKNDKPAIFIKSLGVQEWILNNKRHRENGPAAICDDGSQFWCQEDKLHRLNGPAVIDADGYKAWYQHGKRHREDGPAVIDADGYKAWYQHSKRHREDGPAVIYEDGTQEWWLDDKKYTEEEYYQILESIMKSRELKPSINAKCG